MKIAQLVVGDRDFYLDPDSVQEILSAAAAARAGGTWLQFSDVGGRDLRVLIPSQALLVFREYEIDEPELPVPDTAWADFDYGM